MPVALVSAGDGDAGRLHLAVQPAPQAADASQQLADILAVWPKEEQTPPRIKGLCQPTAGGVSVRAKAFVTNTMRGWPVQELWVFGVSCWWGAVIERSGCILGESRCVLRPENGTYHCSAWWGYREVRPRRIVTKTTLRLSNVLTHARIVHWWNEQHFFVLS